MSQFPLPKPRLISAQDIAKAAKALNYVEGLSPSAGSEVSMTVDHTPFLEVSAYTANGGQKVGKLPGSVELNHLRLLGHPESPIRAIRSKCLDCSGGVSSEVRKCVAITCPLWPLRMGSNPFHGKNAQPFGAVGTPG